MSVDSAYYIEQYLADDDVTYIFQVESLGDIEVYTTTATCNGTRTKLVEDTDYTLELNPYRDPVYKNGKVVLTEPLADDLILQIERKTPITNDVLFVAYDEFNAEQFEYAMDKICFIEQEIEGHACDCRGPELPWPPDPDDPVLCKVYSCSAYKDAITASGQPFWPMDEGNTAMQVDNKATGINADQMTLAGTWNGELAWGPGITPCTPDRAFYVDGPAAGGNRLAPVDINDFPNSKALQGSLSWYQTSAPSSSADNPMAFLQWEVTGNTGSRVAIEIVFFRNQYLRVTAQGYCTQFATVFFFLGNPDPNTDFNEGLYTVTWDVTPTTASEVGGAVFTLTKNYDTSNTITLSDDGGGPGPINITIVNPFVMEMASDLFRGVMSYITLGELVLPWDEYKEAWDRNSLSYVDPDPNCIPP